ncbi:GRP family sugar transporter [Polynucleobacter kasalickyi]|uniref:Glucose uptake protein GlcU n=1 Tax=Polynucleobacter kasalickyi TaxID=1938817 RepID=A0A1W2BWH2_9BURK|nr:GRP family sugar transporter [Polynucleobacter kasalickyi]SMC77300.1 Glucose uptake protein GlcU [Polynucleobacter kasalickyi]
MQNAYLPLALISMCCYGLGDLVFKFAARKGIPAHRFIVLQTVFFLPSALLLGWVTGSLHFGVPFLFGMCAGLTLYFALLYFSISLNTGDVSVVAPVFRSSFVLSATLALLFLNESLTMNKGFAFVLLIIAAFLLLSNLSFRSTNPSPSKTSKTYFRSLAIATVLLGITGFIYKLGAIAGGNSISIVAGQAVVFFTMAFSSCYYKDKKIIFLWKYLYLGFITALFLFLALYFLLEALKSGPASTVVTISQMGFVVTAILGIFIFKEKISVRKVLGLVCSIAAMILLAI